MIDPVVIENDLIKLNICLGSTLSGLSGNEYNGTMYGHTNASHQSCVSLIRSQSEISCSPLCEDTIAEGDA